MDIPLQVFKSNQQTELLTIGLGVLAVVVSIGVLIWLKRGLSSYEYRHYRQLGQMLSGIFLIIGLGVVTGTLYNLGQLSPVKIYPDSVETGYGKVEFKDLKYVYIERAMKNSFVAPSVAVDTTLLAYFEEKSGRSYVLSEDNYEVEAIVKTIRPILDSLNAR